MSIKPFNSIPKDIVEWSRYLEGADVTPTDASITDDTFGNRVGTSVIGRAAADAGKPADIQASADGLLLVRRAGALRFDGLADTDIPSGIARDTDVAAAIASAISGLISQTAADARYVALANVLAGSKTYDPPSLTDGSATTTTVTVTGAALGDYALASHSISLQGIALTAAVTAADTVTVTLFNKTGGTLDIASGTLKARVWKQ